MFKIAVIGPESTGKSVLAKALSEHFNSPWIPEYAREYIENLNVPYTYNDICIITQKQIEQENYYCRDIVFDEKFVFFDTNLIITKVWFQYCFQKIPSILTEQHNKNIFDFYLLCSDDLPWEADLVREHGTNRIFFFNWYKNEIEETKKPYAIVTGEGNVRIQNAIASLNSYFSK